MNQAPRIFPTTILNGTNRICATDQYCSPKVASYRVHLRAPWDPIDTRAPALLSSERTLGVAAAVPEQVSRGKSRETSVLHSIKSRLQGTCPREPIVVVRYRHGAKQPAESHDSAASVSVEAKEQTGNAVKRRPRFTSHVVAAAIR